MKNKKIDMAVLLLIAALLFLGCERNPAGVDPTVNIDLPIYSVLVASPGDCYENRDYYLYAVESYSVDLSEAGVLTAVVCDTLMLDLEMKTLGTGRELIDLSNAVFIAGYTENGELVKYSEY